MITAVVNKANFLGSDDEELSHVKAELADLKKRFGIDKQEEFLKTHANITLKEFAVMLHGDVAKGLG